jgi:hypothetical protein
MVKLSQQKRWIVKLSIIMWVSFLWSSIATMLFFATFDPVVIVKAATFPMQLSRGTGYSVGFLLFWMLLCINSFITSWLIGHDPTRRQKND